MDTPILDCLDCPRCLSEGPQMCQKILSVSKGRQVSQKNVVRRSPGVSESHQMSQQVISSISRFSGMPEYQPCVLHGPSRDLDLQK